MEIDKTRPRLQNPDGSFSTERTIGITVDGKVLSIPTIVGGRQLSPEAAIAEWRAGRNNPVGVYDSVEAEAAGAAKRSQEIGRVRGGGMMRYTIKRGDTLWDLARKHGTTVDELMRMNPHIQDRNKIYAGRAINLPDAPGVPAAAAGSSPSQVSSPQTSTANSGIPPAGAPLEGLIRPPMFPGAEPVPPNQVQQDAAAAAQGMDPGMMDPTALMGLGGTIAAGAITKAIPALARAMPAAQPTAGMVAPTASNVAALPGSQGAAKAMLAAQPPANLQDAIHWYMQQVGRNTMKNWEF